MSGFAAIMALGFSEKPAEPPQSAVAAWTAGAAHEGRRLSAPGFMANKMGATRCTAVLARTDPSVRYADLIERTASIARQKWAARYDHLVFHESDLLQTHQEHIQSSVAVRLRFVSVQGFFAKAKERAAAILEAGGTASTREHGCSPSRWGSGYKAMCAFWFAAFARYSEPCEHLLRVDEDCVIDDEQPDPVESVGMLTDLSASTWIRRANPPVVVGMARLFRLLALNRTGAPVHFVECRLSACWPNPYTNVMLVRLGWIRQMDWAIDAVTRSECILSNRWGDAELWGATLHLARHTDVGGRAADLPLSYVHKGHSVHVRELFRAGEAVRLTGGVVVPESLSRGVPNATRLDRHWLTSGQDSHGLIRLEGEIHGGIVDLSAHGRPRRQALFRNEFVCVPTIARNHAAMIPCGPL